MAKVASGRLDGLHGMTAFTAAGLHALADHLEARAADPSDMDAPGWLRRRATRVRRVAVGKERAVERKDAKHAEPGAAADGDRKAGPRG